MKPREEIMNMLEAFDLTGSLRDAGELVGCCHRTYVSEMARSDEGQLPGAGATALGQDLGVEYSDNLWTPRASWV